MPVVLHELIELIHMGTSCSCVPCSSSDAMLCVWNMMKLTVLLCTLWNTGRPCRPLLCPVAILWCMALICVVLLTNCVLSALLLLYRARLGSLSVYRFIRYRGCTSPKITIVHGPVDTITRPLVHPELLIICIMVLVIPWVHCVLAPTLSSKLNCCRFGCDTEVLFNVRCSAGIEHCTLCRRTTTCRNVDNGTSPISMP